MERTALPAGIFAGNEKVAWSFAPSSVTAAFCCLPAAVMVTDWKAISTALRVMAFTGSLTSMSMVSTPVKVAALRSGVRVRA